MQRLKLPGPSQVNQLQVYRPQCPKCGAIMWLEHIEPSDEPDHDLRTFECPNCSQCEAVKMRFR